MPEESRSARQARHQSAGLEFVDLFLEDSNRVHATVHSQPLFNGYAGFCIRRVHGGCHRFTPDISAKTSKTTAKSCSTIPIPRAAVRNSFATAVNGRGTST